MEHSISTICDGCSPREPCSPWPTDYEDAAAIYRSCRIRGETVRRMIDCLTAAVAIREGVPVLHADHDFDVIARHTTLQLVQ